MKKLRSCVPVPARRWWRTRQLDSMDRFIDVREQRTIRFLAAEEEQSACARRAIERSIERPTREGRVYTRTDVADCARLERKYNWHQFKARQYISALNKYSAMRVQVDSKRQVFDGVDDDLSDLSQKLEDIDKTPMKTAMESQQRNQKTATILEKHTEAAKMVQEGSRAVGRAADQAMVELTEDGEVEEEEEKTDAQRSTFARIEARFAAAAAAMSQLPPAPTRALLMPPISLAPRTAAAAARSKQVKGKKYEQLVENKEELLEL